MRRGEREVALVFALLREPSHTWRKSGDFGFIFFPVILQGNVLHRCRLHLWVPTLPCFFILLSSLLSPPLIKPTFFCLLIYYISFWQKSLGKCNMILFWDCQGRKEAGVLTQLPKTYPIFIPDLKIDQIFLPLSYHHETLSSAGPTFKFQSSNMT